MLCRVVGSWSLAQHTLGASWSGFDQRIGTITISVSCSVSLSSLQICVGKLEDGEVFLKLSSGKKRGLVPTDSIEEIWGPELTSLFFSYTSCWDGPVTQPSPSPLSCPTFASPSSPDLNQTDGNWRNNPHRNHRPRGTHGFCLNWFTVLITVFNQVIQFS